MSRVSQIIFRSPLAQTSTPVIKTHFVGEPVRADLWYGATNHIYTVSVHGSAFVGDVTIEATLMPEPEDHDWFTVQFYEFAHDPTQTIKTFGFSFSGLFTWIRAQANVKEGAIDRILLNQ